MMLHVGTVDCTQQLYVGQAGVQAALVFVALISVPWMLLIKPIVLYMRLPKPPADAAVPGAQLLHDGDDEQKEDFHALVADQAAKDKRGSGGGHGEHHEFVSLFFSRRVFLYFSFSPT